MNTSVIYKFISALCKCEYHALEAPMDISQMRYNGITYNEGPETYRRILIADFSDFKAEVLEISMRENAKKSLAAILADIKEGINQYWDIPDDDYLTALQQEYNNYGTSSLLSSIREIKFLQEMSSIQKGLLQESASYVEALMGANEAENLVAETTNPKQIQQMEDSSRIISGTKGLANYLGCSNGTAFGIIKSRVLMDNKIQYKVGENWKFNREKLDKYISENPEILGARKKK